MSSGPSLFTPGAPAPSTLVAGGVRSVLSVTCAGSDAAPAPETVRALIVVTPSAGMSS
jgi:hypothetical protein